MKKILLVILMILVLGTATGCNRTILDTTWNFEEAYIELPGGEVIHGKLQSWKDFDQSDMIQITIDGKTYLTHSSNVVMISK